jgi:hypothetical protein
MANSLASQVVAQLSRAVRDIASEAQSAGNTASVNADAACSVSEKKTTETSAEAVTTYYILSPEMQWERKHAWDELYLPLSDQNIGKDRICSHMADTRDALRKYIAMIEPHKERTRRNSGIPENVRANALSTLDEDRGNMQNALSDVEKNIADFHDRCAAQALEFRAAAVASAPKPAPTPAPAPQVDAKFLCFQARRDFESRNNAAALPGLLRCIALQAQSP